MALGGAWGAAALYACSVRISLDPAPSAARMNAERDSRPHFRGEAAPFSASNGRSSDACALCVRQPYHCLRFWPMTKRSDNAEILILTPSQWEFVMAALCRRPPTKYHLLPAAD